MKSLFPSGSHALLLQAALGEGSMAATAYRQWRRSVDFDALDVASQRILPLLVGSPALPVGPADPTLERCAKIARFTWLKSRLLITETEPAVAALTSAGIPVMGLKGIAVVHHTGGALAARPMDDIDLAVPVDRAGEALGLLGGLGFVASGPLPDAKELERWFAFDHGLELRNRRGASIDLHWHPSGLDLTARTDRGYWSSARPGYVGRQPCSVSSVTHTVVSVIGHALTGPAVTLRWATDVTALVRRADGCGLDWDELVEMARRQKIEVAVGTAFEQLARMVGLESPAQVRRLRMAPSVTQQLERGRGRQAACGGRSGPSRLMVINAAYLEHARRTGASGGQAYLRFAEDWLARGGTQVDFPDLEPGSEIRFDLGGAGHACLGAGWSHPEAHGTWSNGRFANLGAGLPWAGDGPICLFLRFVPFLPPGRPRLRVDLSVGGERVGRWHFSGPGWHPAERTVTVPARLVQNGLRVRFGFDRPVSPDAVGPDSGPRALAISINSLRVDQVAPGDAGPADAAH